MAHPVHRPNAQVHDVPGYVFATLGVQPIGGINTCDKGHSSSHPYYTSGSESLVYPAATIAYAEEKMQYTHWRSSTACLFSYH